jgi:type II secretory pathway component PulF
MSMMSLRQIADAAAALRNQLSAGIPARDAAEAVADLQPEYADFWHGVVRSIDAGNSPSTCFDGVWPDSFVSAMKAGEEAGVLEETLNRIDKTVTVQIAIRKQMSKLWYPAGISLIGVALFLVMMIVVVPMTSAAFGDASKRDPSIFTTMSAVMESVAKEYWLPICIGLAISIFMVAKWLQTEEGKETVLEFFLGMPVIGPAMVNLYFGLWGEYIALMAMAGIPLIQGLELTIKSLPRALRDGVHAFHRDITYNSLTLAEAADPKKRDLLDPRSTWPRYISWAFMAGEKTGRIDIEMQRAAPLLVSDGTAKMEKAIKVGEIAALAFSGLLIAMSFAAIYMPIFSALRNAR